MKGYALKKERKTIEIALSSADLWRTAKALANPSHIYNYNLHKQDKDRLRGEGWDVVEIEFKGKT